MSYQILLVEDDDSLQETVQDYLEAKGLSVTTAENSEVAMEALWQQSFDLLLLDIMLPGQDGFSLCREIRQHSDVPIMFLTARMLEEDKIHGYSLGCDDYLVKPFSLAELHVRILALIKRSKGMVLSQILTAGSISLDPSARLVTVGGEWIPLTKKEYALLKALMERKDQTVSRDRLLHLVWGGDFDGNDRVVDNHIRKLRKALGKASKSIRTVIGVGYRLEDKL